MTEKSLEEMIAEAKAQAESSADDAEAWTAENVGDSIAGRILGSHVANGPHGEFTVLTVETSDGTHRSVAMVGAVLKDKVQTLDLSPGRVLYVEYKGSREGASGKSYQDYAVSVVG